MLRQLFLKSLKCCRTATAAFPQVGKPPRSATASFPEAGNLPALLRLVFLHLETYTAVINMLICR